jgi:Zn-finger nucleic acid-binding protein
VERSTKPGLLCPACFVDLVMTDRQGVEIDYCPKCRGVWLDRGELDKIIERNSAYEARERPPEHREYQRPPEYRPRERDYRGHYDDDDYRRRHRRKSFLSEIFDFD